MFLSLYGCEVSQSLIMKCEQLFASGDVFDGYTGQEH